MHIFLKISYTHRLTTTLSAVLLVTGCLFSACTPAPDMDALERQLTERLDTFQGDTGLYLRHIPSGREIAIRADSLFPTASMIKVPILATLADRVERGQLEWTQEMVYRDSLFYSDEDITGELRDSATVSLDKLARLMTSYSDNTASLWLQEMAGTGVAINQWLVSSGFEATRMNSRTPGRRGDWEKYGWGQTTPREMARLLVMIAEGRAVSRAASERMLRLLSGSYWDGEMLSVLPPDVEVASKQGAVSASKSEVVYVHAPGGDYVLCLITSNQEDTRWASENEGYVLLRDVSRMVWSAFEPDVVYSPPSGLDRWAAPAE